MERSAFFNSISGDRRYKAEDFAGYFSKFVTNGIFPLPADNLRAAANDAMTIEIHAGTGYINGYLYENTDSLYLAIPTADGVQPRIDRIALRWSQLDRDIRIIIKPGTPAANPVAPELTRNADIFELGLADISVPRGAYEIREMDITDTRLNTEACGIVNSIIQADTAAIFNQYLDWYNRTKTQHESDIAVLMGEYEQAKSEWLEDMAVWFNGATSDFESLLIQTHSEYTEQAEEYLAQIESLIGDAEAGELLNRVRWLQENLGFIAIDGGEFFDGYYEFSPDGGMF